MLASCIPLCAAAVLLGQALGTGNGLGNTSGLCWADYSQQRNDIHFIRLSRNLPAAGASLSLGPSPARRSCSQRPGAGRGRRSLQGPDASGPQEGSWALPPPPTPPRDNWRQPFLTCFSDLLSLGFPHVSQSEGKASCIPAGQQAGGPGIRTVGMGPS